MNRAQDVPAVPLLRLVARTVAGSVLVAFALLAVVAATASASFSSELRRYPYLTDVVGNSATINWGTTRLSISGVVRYGEVGAESCTAHTAPTTRTAITVGTELQFQWKSRLTLSPDSEYCYRVYIDTNPEIDLLGDDPSPSFKTQIPAGSSDPFSFAVFGDWGEIENADGTNPDQANLMSQIAGSGARFAITTGDNAYPNGSQTNYGDLIQTGLNTSAVFGPEFWTKAGASIPAFPAIGNHGFAGGTTHFTNWPQDTAASSSVGRYLRETYCCLNGSISGEYPSAWYAFDAGNARFYVLESAWTPTNIGTSDEYGMDYAYHWAPNSAQYQWLQNDLATNPRPLKFAFGHYPMYSDNEHEESDPYLRGPDSLEGLLSRYGVDIAFSGHAHTYQRNAPAPSHGLPTYLTGGGGAHLQSIGTDGCSANDLYGIGWSKTSNTGSACGAAPEPTEAAQVYHFLKVNVGGGGVTVTPTDELGRAFDTATFPHSTSNADLSLSISDAADPVLVGQTVTYTLEARNDGPDDASGVVVTDKLPTGASYDSATSSQGDCSERGDILTCALGSIASGGSASVDIEVTPQSTGTITNEASVVGDDLSDPIEINNSASEDTAVNEPADLSITKADSADPVVVGATITYTLSVHNGGPLNATGVTVTDELPTGVTYQTATPSQGSCSEAAGTVSCELGSLDNGADATVDIAVSADSAGSITNKTSVRADQGDSESSNNTDSEETTVQPRTETADLSLTKSDSPDPVHAGQELTYSVNVRNNGPSDATGVTVKDNLPTGVTYESATPSHGSCLESEGAVSCSLGSLANGSSATIEIKVKPQKAGTITNSANVQSDVADPVDANNSDSEETTVDPAADLKIWMADYPDPGYVGQAVYYGILVKNYGPSDATGVTVSDTLPATVNLEWAAASSGTCFQPFPGQLSCTIGSIPSGEYGWVAIKVKPQSVGTIVNQASVAGWETDLANSNNAATEQTTVRPSADVAVTQTDSPDPVIEGQTLTYTLSIKNNGPSPATGVTATDTLPSNVTYQSATPSQGSCTQSAATVSCNLGNLASGSRATVTIKVTPTKAGDISNRASTRANEHDPSTGNNSSTAGTRVNKK